MAANSSTWRQALLRMREPHPRLELEDFASRSGGLPALLLASLSVQADFIRSIPVRSNSGKALARLGLFAARAALAFALAYLVTSRSGAPGGAWLGFVMLLMAAAFHVGGPFLMLCWTWLVFAVARFAAGLVGWTFGFLDPDWWVGIGAYWRGGGSLPLSWLAFAATLLAIWLILGPLLCRRLNHALHMGIKYLAILDGMHRFPQMAAHKVTLQSDVEEPVAAPATATGPEAAVAFIGGDMTGLRDEDLASIERQGQPRPMEFVSGGQTIATVQPPAPRAPPQVQTVPPQNPRPSDSERLAGDQPEPPPNPPIDPAPVPEAQSPAKPVPSAETRQKKLASVLNSFRVSRSAGTLPRFPATARVLWRDWSPDDLVWLAGQPDGIELLNLRTQHDPVCGGSRIVATNVGKPFAVGPGDRPPKPEPVADEEDHAARTARILASIQEGRERARLKADAAAATAAVAPPEPPTHIRTELVSPVASTGSEPDDELMQRAGPPDLVDKLAQPVALATVEPADYRPFADRGRVGNVDVLEAVVISTTNRPSTDAPDSAFSDMRAVIGLHGSGISFRQVAHVGRALAEQGIDEARLRAAMALMAGIRDDVLADCRQLLVGLSQRAGVHSADTALRKAELALDDLTRNPARYHGVRGDFHAQLAALEDTVMAAHAFGGDPGLINRVKTVRTRFGVIGQLVRTRDFAALRAMSVAMPQAEQSEQPASTPAQMAPKPVAKPILTPNPAPEAKPDIGADIGTVMASLKFFGRWKEPGPPADPAENPQAPPRSAKARFMTEPAPTPRLAPPIRSQPLPTPTNSAPPVQVPPVRREAAVSGHSGPGRNSTREIDLATPRSPALATAAAPPPPQSEPEAGLEDVAEYDLARLLAVKGLPAAFVSSCRAIAALLTAARTSEGDSVEAAVAGRSEHGRAAMAAARSDRLAAAKLAIEARTALTQLAHLPEDATDDLLLKTLAAEVRPLFVSFILKPVARAAALNTKPKEDEPEPVDTIRTPRSGPVRRALYETAMAATQEQIAPPSTLGAEPDAPGKIGRSDTIASVPTPMQPTAPKIPRETIRALLRAYHRAEIGTQMRGSVDLWVAADVDRTTYIDLVGFRYNSALQAMTDADGLAVYIGTLRRILAETETAILLLETPADLATMVGEFALFSATDLLTIQKGHPQ